MHQDRLVNASYRDDWLVPNFWAMWLQKDVPRGRRLRSRDDSAFPRYRVFRWREAEINTTKAEFKAFLCGSASTRLHFSTFQGNKINPLLS